MVRIGGSGVSLDLRHWVNEGLMTFFFLVVGLEARRESGLGELRIPAQLPARIARGGRCRLTARAASVHAADGHEQDMYEGHTARTRKTPSPRGAMVSIG
jgi:Na+/H+ antiporter NhaA